jgi:hypothetical protein
LLIIALQILIPYALVEAVVTARAWWTRSDASYFLLEDTGRTFFFDPIRGYRLGITQARCALYVRGQWEYFGTFRGNAQGFPYRGDFGPARPNAATRRFAVFGDSFTHAPFLSQSWPERVEDRFRDKGESVALLNFGQWGAGLANWWSIITKILDREKYELDGVIFAVYESDLRRRFTVFTFPETHGPHQPPLFGRWKSWDPQSLPKTAEEAHAIDDEGGGYRMLDYDEFERAIQGAWPAGVERPFEPILYSNVKRYFQTPKEKTLAPTEEWHGFDSDRTPLIADIRRYLHEHNLPALVVNLPYKDDLLAAKRPPSLHLEEARQFAQGIGATFVDAGDDFTSQGPEETRTLFLPHDLHWNQKGSNRFAEIVMAHLPGASARSP